MRQLVLPLLLQGEPLQRQQQAEFKAGITAPLLRQCPLFGSCLTVVCSDLRLKLHHLLSHSLVNCLGVRRCHAAGVFNIHVYMYTCIHVYIYIYIYICIYIYIYTQRETSQIRTLGNMYNIQPILIYNYL